MWHQVSFWPVIFGRQFCHHLWAPIVKTGSAYVVPEPDHVFPGPFRRSPPAISGPFWPSGPLNIHGIKAARSYLHLRPGSGPTRNALGYSFVLLRPDLGTTHFFIWINSCYKSLDSIQLMTQAAFAGIASDSTHDSTAYRKHWSWFSSWLKRLPKTSIRIKSWLKWLSQELNLI